jgi:hypothetical protein
VLKVRGLKYQGGFAFTVAFAWVAPLLTSVLAFLFKKTSLSFLIITSIYVLIEFLTPAVVRLAGAYFNTDVPSIVNSIPANIYWFVAAFKIDYGVKVLVAAIATRFLIRRLPFVG